MVSIASDGSLYVYESGTDEASSSPSGFLEDAPLHLRGHERGVSDVAWSPDSRFLASASDDLTIAIWRPEREKTRRTTPTDASATHATLKGHTNYVFCLSWGPTGGILASGSFDESVRLWDVYQPGVCLRTMQAHADPVTGVSFSPDGTLLASSSYDGLM